MADWPQWIADFADAMSRFLRPRRRRPAPAPAPLRLEPLSTRILFSVGWTIGPRVLAALEPDVAAIASPQLMAPAVNGRHDAAPPAVLDQQTERSDQIRTIIPNPADRDDPRDRILPFADLYNLLLQERHSVELRHTSAPSAADVAPEGEPTGDAMIGSPAAPAPAGRADGGGIADDLAAGDAAASRSGTAEIDVGDPGGQAADLLVVDWTTPTPQEELTPLRKANLAFVPTYVVMDASPPAAAPMHSDAEAPLDLAAVLVGPGDLQPAAPGVDSSARRQDVVDRVFHDSPLPTGDASPPTAGGLGPIATPLERLFGDLPQACGDYRTAAVALLEALVVFGAWRLTEADGRAAE
ncbi:MAG TPA: hypothetical protein VMS17_07665 [Gemmataceae bacterium]|nr:hypothetical protein [Gemmataceae bacterium]